MHYRQFSELAEVLQGIKLFLIIKSVADVAGHTAVLCLQTL